MIGKFLLAGLRTLLALGILLMLLAQVLLLPWMSGWMASDYPEVAYMRWPVLAMSVVGLLCLEVMFIAVWKLLDAVHGSLAFSPRSYHWIDVIVWSLGVATATTVVFFIYVMIGAVGPISVPAFGLLLVLTSAGLLLLMMTMRSLFHQATALQVEMDSVI